MIQQTVVEWFAEQIIRKHPILTQFLPNYNFDKEIIEQAKEMEKEQHYTTWLTAQMNYPDDDYVGITETFEKYYNQNYGK